MEMVYKLNPRLRAENILKIKTEPRPQMGRVVYTNAKKNKTLTFLCAEFCKLHQNCNFVTLKFLCIKEHKCRAMSDNANNS